MATVNQVEKKVKINTWSIVKYQIFTYCFLHEIKVSDAVLECLTLLCMQGEQELTSFCNEVFSRKIFRSTQTVRNALGKAEQKDLIIKEGKTKKKIRINPVLNVLSEGSIMLDYKFLAVAS